MHPQPVRTRLIPGDGPFCEDNFVISFYLPFDYQVRGGEGAVQCAEGRGAKEEEGACAG